MSEISGLLPVYKPAGITSKDVSRQIIKRFGKLKIGHVGTLDPDADGVLTVLIGSATKLQDYLLEMPKSYRFTIRFGTATSTLDASGEVTETKDYSHLTEAAIKAAAQEFIGKIEQLPPLYSAVKLRGKELYKYARNGTLALDAEDTKGLIRSVFVYNIEIIGFNDSDCDVLVHCSKGTYVRTLAQDLAHRLGTVGHVTFLRRILSSGVSIEQCQMLETITSQEHDLTTFLVPMDRISIGLPIWTSSDNVLLRRIRDGQHVSVHLTEFLQNLTGQDELGAVRIPSVLIRNSEKLGVGIGELRFDNDQVYIHLKRGL